jgi:hypothetical protein
MNGVIDRIEALERRLPGGQLDDVTRNEFANLMREFINILPDYQNNQLIQGAIDYIQGRIDERNNEEIIRAGENDLLGQVLAYLENPQQGGRRKRSRKARKSRKGRKGRKSIRRRKL